ncbi:hypothetical protein [Paraburkholderia terrae]
MSIASPDLLFHLRARTRGSRQVKLIVTASSLSVNNECGVIDAASAGLQWRERKEDGAASERRQ